MAGAPNHAAARSATTALTRPPSVPAPAICPKRRFAVCGSNRSLAISQTRSEQWAGGRNMQVRRIADTVGEAERSAHHDEEQAADQEKGRHERSRLKPASHAPVQRDQQKRHGGGRNQHGR